MPDIPKHVPVYKLGKYVGPGNPTHGIASTYRSARYACRCSECREANNTLVVQERANRNARLQKDPTLVEHGKSTTYRNWGCRCQPCSEDHSRECKAYQDSLKSGPKSGPES